MLSARERIPTVLEQIGRQQTIRRAEVGDLWRLAVGHSRAQTTRSRRLTRYLVVLAPVTTTLRLIGPVGRGEVWTCGVGTSVVMTPDRPRRIPAQVTVFAITVHGLAIVVLPAGVVIATVGVGGPIEAVGPAAAIGWLTGLLLPLLATIRRSRRADAVPMLREGLSGRTVRLHDLARHPDDPVSTGTQLLAAVLTEPAYDDDVVVAVAASRSLADLYAAAGMSAQRSGRTVGETR